MSSISGHGAFIAVGAYLAMTTLIPLAGWVEANSLPLNLLALGLAMLVAMLGTGAIGLAFERVIIMPVYGQHLKQILITTGGLIVAEQLIHVVWGGDQKPMTLPTALRGAIIFGDIALGKVPPAGRRHWAHHLSRHAGAAEPQQTRVADPRRRRKRRDGGGAGLSHPPPVRLGLCRGLGARRPRRYALGRSTAETLTASIGSEVIVLVFVVIIIGGLGSVGGCFLGALLVAQMANYTGYLAPKVAIASNILLMVAILMWRPQGLYPVAKR